jgi:hypothetical protein
MSPAETDLLATINRGLPHALRTRYRELIGKRQTATLTPAEHRELLGLTDQVESLEAERAEALLGLARHRGQPLEDLLKDLGMPTAPQA